MPRRARTVLPRIAHHITQRGNRQQKIFFSEEDYQFYVNILHQALDRSGTQCLAWCLMPNHIHLILVPEDEDGLRGPLASTHTTYSQYVNRKQGVSGHLFQGRFASYPMDDAHLMVAMRYVENNPVKAKLAGRAEDWRWSSARAHIDQQPDRLTDLSAQPGDISNWRAMLSDGLEASDQIDSCLNSGRPLASEKWLKERSEMFDWVVNPAKRGRPAKKQIR